MSRFVNCAMVKSSFHSNLLTYVIAKDWLQTLLFKNLIYALFLLNTTKTTF